MKVYAVYVIPKSPEYQLAGLYLTKESAKKRICELKHGFSNHKYKYDIQLEDVHD